MSVRAAFLRLRMVVFPALPTSLSKCSAVLQFAALKYAESRFRVRYKETDAMGIAHHSNYIVWFEIGRTDLCRLTGFPYTEIERRGYLLVVTEIQCRYRIPFRYDDEVVIRTSVAETGSRIMKFAYELFDAAGTFCASGSSSHFWVDRQTRKPVRADAEVMAAFAAYLRDASSDSSRTAPDSP